MPPSLCDFNHIPKALEPRFCFSEGATAQQAQLDQSEAVRRMASCCPCSSGKPLSAREGDAFALWQRAPEKPHPVSPHNVADRIVRELGVRQRIRELGQI